MGEGEDSKQALTVGDLFCGGGGFSEGFEQAGFRVVWGVDNWGPATETFQRNHPRARVYSRNIMSLDPGDLDPVDVLIGSPPCVQFSLANRGGNGDRALGMKLVRRYLTFVRALAPRYWVFENVPSLLQDLSQEMSGSSIELHSGGLAVPRVAVLDAAKYNTPQARRRLYTGDFPQPKPIDVSESREPTTLRRILEGLPSPLAAVHASRRIADPNYEEVRIESRQLRDHFEDSRCILTESEVRSSERQKRFHPVYGKMEFPDSIDRACRTITATRTRGSRSTIVIPAPERSDVPFRTLTLREAACAQGFPLTYQFWASSMSDKDRLVGNAVPPPVARAIAIGILEAEGRRRPRRLQIDPVVELPPPLAPRRITSRRFSMSRRFRGVVPVDWRHDHRLELDNESSGSGRAIPSPVVRAIEWKARVYLGYATEYRCYRIRMGVGLKLARIVCAEPELAIPGEMVTRMLAATAKRCLRGFPDSDLLQRRWSGLAKGAPTPQSILDLVAELIDGTFPPVHWRGKLLAINETGPVIIPERELGGKRAGVKQPVPMSVRLTLGAAALAIMCERVNRGAAPIQDLLENLERKGGIEARELDSYIMRASNCGSGSGYQTSFAWRKGLQK